MLDDCRTVITFGKMNQSDGSNASSIAFKNFNFFVEIRADFRENCSGVQDGVPELISFGFHLHFNIKFPGGCHWWEVVKSQNVKVYKSNEIEKLECEGMQIGEWIHMIWTWLYIGRVGLNARCKVRQGVVGNCIKCGGHLWGILFGWFLFIITRISYSGTG